MSRRKRDVENFNYIYVNLHISIYDNVELGKAVEKFSINEYGEPEKN